MSSKYVPPHLRNKQQSSEPEQPQKPRNHSFNNNRSFNNRKNQERIEQEQKELEKKKQLENTDENFPSLGNVSVKPKTWNGQRTFANLANEWKELTEEEKEQEQIKKEQQQKFNNVKVIPSSFHRRVYETPVSYQEVQEYPTSSNDEWKTVDKKVRVVHEKTIAEMEQEDLQKEIALAEDNFTIWDTHNQPAQHETYWDERQY